MDCCCLVAKWDPTHCDPMDCSLPYSSAHRISQARILDWVAISFSRGFSQPRARTKVSCTADRFFTNWTSRESQGSVPATGYWGSRAASHVESWGNVASAPTFLPSLSSPPAVFSASSTMMWDLLEGCLCLANLENVCPRGIWVANSQAGAEHPQHRAGSPVGLILLLGCCWLFPRKSQL